MSDTSSRDDRPVGCAKIDARRYTIERLPADVRVDVAMDGPRCRVQRQVDDPATRFFEPDHIARRRLDDELPLECASTTPRNSPVSELPGP